MNATAAAQVATATTSDRHPCACSTVIAFTENGEPRVTHCTATTKRIFAPGHDARLKGFLIRAGAEGHEVTFAGSGRKTTAQEMANGFGFGHMVADGIRAAKDRAFAKLMKAATKKTAKKATPAPTKVTAKVGRWVYEGTVTGGEFTYTDKRGNAVTTAKFTKI